MQTSREIAIQNSRYNAMLAHNAVEPRSERILRQLDAVKNFDIDKLPNQEKYKQAVAWLESVKEAENSPDSSTIEDVRPILVLFGVSGIGKTKIGLKLIESTIEKNTSYIRAPDYYVFNPDELRYAISRSCKNSLAKYDNDSDSSSSEPCYDCREYDEKDLLDCIGWIRGSMFLYMFDDLQDMKEENSLRVVRSFLDKIIDADAEYYPASQLIFTIQIPNSLPLDYEGWNAYTDEQKHAICLDWLEKQLSGFRGSTATSAAAIVRRLSQYGEIILIES